MRFWPCSTRTLPRFVVCCSVVTVIDLSFASCQRLVSGPWPAVTRRATAGMVRSFPISRLHHVCGLSVQLLVEALLLGSIGDANRRDHVDHLQHRVGEEEGVGGTPDTGG